MIKCEVIEKFTLKDFNKLKNIQRKSVDVIGGLFVGDTFECDEEMAKYLTGSNSQKKVVVKVLEVLPKAEATIEYHEEEKEPKAVVKTTKKKKTSKK